MLEERQWTLVNLHHIDTQFFGVFFGGGNKITQLPNVECSFVLSAAQSLLSPGFVLGYNTMETLGILPQVDILLNIPSTVDAPLC